MTTLTKATLAQYLEEHIGLEIQQASFLVDAFFEQIATALEKGEPVKLSGFGQFSVRHKKARPGRNPKTGEEITVTARRSITFHASSRLKKRLVETGE